MTTCTISKTIESHPIYITKTWYKQYGNETQNHIENAKTLKKSNIHIYKVPYINVLSIVPLQVQPIARFPEGYPVIVYELVSHFL